MKNLPEIRLKRTPLSDSRGNLQTSISHCTSESVFGSPWTQRRTNLKIRRKFVSKNFIKEICFKNKNFLLTFLSARNRNYFCPTPIEFRPWCRQVIGVMSSSLTRWNAKLSAWPALLSLIHCDEKNLFRFFMLKF
jgi:hypothetical protein